MTAPTGRKLRIAQVGPLWTSVPPDRYGGAELMVSWLTEELVRRGHDVTLFASGDSRTAAKLRPVCERNIIEAMSRGEAFVYEPYAVSALADALKDAASFDVIHSHLGCAYVPLAELSGTPVLHTVHAALDLVDELWVLKRYPRAPIAAISRSQVALALQQGRGDIRVIYHGCDFARFAPSFSEGKYLAFISRMGPQKNPLGAIQIAKKAGIPIVLAGKPQNAAEQAYFEAQVKPLFDGRNVIYHGEVNETEKYEFLRDARALLFPIQWDEHFGLVMIEAMACGTPVVACRRGSVPEVVDPGITGYFADSVDDLPALVPKALALDRRALWEHAKARFNHLRMVDEYVETYERLVDRRPLPPLG
jgi:glycosyltransferase involved in cell wall biosynthesis